MTPTTYQKPEIRDANDNIIQQGAFGKNTALCTATNDGWIDYVANDLEFLYDLAKDEVVPVPALPASGQTNKTYLLTTTGVSYRWSGTEWVAVSSSEAVGRAEAAANLAEQWATKTDGSVDGTEYSAKYYAQQAEQSADDAQDVADDMATHLVQIDKNTGGVSKNSKRISNIEKLLQGNLYDYDTDDDSAYTKTVPSGALPYAGIEQIGGKTLVWNQLLSVNDTTRTSNGMTFEFSNNVCTYNGKLTGFSTAYIELVTRTSGFIAGHKYYYVLKANPTQGDATPFYSSISMGGYWEPSTNFPRIYTADSSSYIRVRFRTNQTIVDQDMQRSGTMVLQLFDLTLMFGAGNEPSTVAEFEAMFPAQYYPYNAGTLLSAGVTEVKSVGKNLAYYGGGAGVPSNTATSNATKRIFEVGKYVLGLTYSNYYYSGHVDTVVESTNSLSFISRNSIYGVGIPFNCKPSTDYSVSVGTITNGKAVVRWYGADGSPLTYSSQTVPPYSVTSPADAKQGVLCLYSATTNQTSTFQNIQVEENSSVTPYSPAGVIATYPIPAEVQALEGYGWSAGTAYNYIDFERKVFVQNVGRLHYDSTGWTLRNTQENGIKTYSRQETLVTNFNAGYISNVVKIKISSYSVGYTGGVSWLYDAGTGVAVLSGGNYVYINTTDISNTDLNIYYPLATPIETDISQYLTDNLLEVGAGGTLTFENSNGDDYHIPIPSTETYMIDLQEAISNG